MIAGRVVVSRPLALAIFAALCLLLGAIGLARYRPLVSIFDVPFWMGDSARAMAGGSPCVDMTRAQLQLVDASQTTFRFCAHRRPLVPALLAAFSFVTKDPRVAAIVKAVTTAAMLALSTFIALGRHPRITRWQLAIAAVAIFNPFVLSQAAGLEVEEAYAIPILAALTAIVLQPPQRDRAMHAVYFAVLTAALVLTKSGYAALSLAFPLWLLLSRPTRRRWVTMALAAVVMAHLVIGASAWVSTGRFRVDASIDWWNAYKGNQPETSQFYSWTGLDEMPIRTGNTRFNNEWEFSAYFRARVLATARDEPLTLLRHAGRHAWEFFGRLDSGSSNLRERIDGPLTWLIALPAVIGIRLLILFSIVLSAWSLLTWTRGSRESAIPLEAGWLVIVAAAALPFVLGFAYLRHVTPLVIPAAFVCIHALRGRLASFVQ